MREWDDARGLRWEGRVLRVKKVFRVSYMTVIHRIIEAFPSLVAGRNLNMEFALWYKAKYGHDLKDHFEPDPIGLFANDFAEDRFSRLVRLAWEREIISITRAAELLDLSLGEMRDLTRSWKEL
jgi:hypothetical protein